MAGLNRRARMAKIDILAKMASRVRLTESAKMAKMPKMAKMTKLTKTAR